MVKINGVEIVLPNAKEAFLEILETIPETPYNSRLWESDGVMDSNCFDVEIDGQFYTVNRGIGKIEFFQINPNKPGTMRWIDVILTNENFETFDEAYYLCCK